LFFFFFFFFFFFSLNSFVSDGNANYFSASANQNIGVGLASQTISISSSAPTGAVYNTGSYVPTATASSGLVVAITASGACTMSGGTVLFSAGGSCTVRFDQSGNGSFDAAPTRTQVFNISPASQTVSFTSVAPTARVGGATYTVAASATSGLAVSFASNTASVCTVSGSTVSFLSVGSCTIQATQAGNTNFNSATNTQTFSVGQGTQTLTWSSTIPASASVAGPTYTLVAVSSASGMTPTYSSGSPAVCSVSGTTCSFVATGTCFVIASQSGNANYLAASDVQQSFTVGRGSQTVSFSSPAPSAAQVSGATYTPSGTSTSGLAVSFSVTTPAVCAISAGIVSFVATGTCSVACNQAGSVDYNAAPQVLQSFTVALGTQTLSFTTAAPSAAAVAGATYTPGATSNRGLAGMQSKDVLLLL
jgi:hypothetical protein